MRRAHETFSTFRHTSFAERAGWMNRAAELLEGEAERYGRMMTEEMGKPLEAARAEARKCASACRYYAEHAERFLQDEPVQTPPEQLTAHVCVASHAVPELLQVSTAFTLQRTAPGEHVVVAVHAP